MNSDKLKIIIIDDSRVFRNVVEEVLRPVKDIEIIGSAWNGVMGIELVKSNPPDLVTLDVEMPEKDGIETLREIMEFNQSHPDIPDIGVIMVSAYTKKGADITIKALEIGAHDFVPKPSGCDVVKNMTYLRKELLGKIRNYVPKGKNGLPKGTKKPIHPTPPPGTAATVDVAFRKSKVKAMVIGVSTGGPKALALLLPALCEVVDLPILIVQHMPATFTKSLAENLDKKCRHRVIEAVDNGVIMPNTVYIAPGGRHMAVRRNLDGHIATEVNDRPPEKGCRPSVDIMFRSAASIYGGEVISLILTGMGSDGTQGLEPLKKAGSLVIAQDEDSSVVWGMPGSATAAGMVDHVLPLDEIASFVKENVRNGSDA